MSEISENEFPVGTRVLVVGRHAHSGKTGTIERYEYVELLDKTAPVIRFDDGLSGFVFHTSMLRKIT